MLEFVDFAFKLRKFSSNAYVYQRADQHGKAQNSLAILQMTSRSAKIITHEEFEGDIVQYHCQKHEVIVLIKSHANSKYYLKTLVRERKLVVKSSVVVSDLTFIGHFSIADGIAHNIVYAGNDFFNIPTKNNVQTRVHSGCIPIQQDLGDYVILSSPLLCSTYNKIAYFIKNN